MREHLLTNLEVLQQLSIEERLKQRYAKFRAHGHFTEKQKTAAGGVNATLVAAVANADDFLLFVRLSSIRQDRLNP